MASAGSGMCAQKACCFEQLYLESYNLVYSYIRPRMACEADAQDIVAEAYLKAARSFDSFDPTRAKFSTWVITIARNCMISFFRKAHPTLALDDVSELHAPDSMHVEDDQDAFVNRDTALRLLAALTDEEREVVLLKYQEDMRNVDIARTLGMNASTVSTKLATALAKMRDKAAEEAW